MIKKLFRFIGASLVMLVGVFSILGTGPKEPSLTLKPEKYCSTSKIHIEWSNATSDTTISANPKIFNDFKAQPSGGSSDKNISISNLPTSAPYEIEISMKGTADGKKFETTKKVQILPPGATEKLYINFTPDCSQGDQPIWSESIVPDLWDSSIKIKSVGNMSGRKIWVGHESSPSTVLQSNGYTNAFNGQTPSGSWNAKAELQQPDLTGIGSTGYYEACKPLPSTTGIGQGAVHKQPPSLKVVVSYGC